ncbi:MAG: hypothetical protein HY819_14040 [Acidobacteria bacterium]|nr:hypothetical protein [Acidobacteriota bacterium]
MIKILSLIILTLFVMTFINCSDKKINLNPSANKENVLISWPSDWTPYLNKKVVLEGIAIDSKLGAQLLGKDNSIWIDGLDSWPKGFYQGGSQGKLLHVTGIVIERSDLPVFVPKEGEPQKTGIPVSQESDIPKAQKRFLLKDASWETIDKP